MKEAVVCIVSWIALIPAASAETGGYPASPSRRSAVILGAWLSAGAACVPASAATIRITMQNLEIAPAAVSAKVGDTIEWINKDVLVHTATARNGDFDVTLPPKKTVSLVLKKAGTVDHYCRYHPNMKARLDVEP